MAEKQQWTRKDYELLLRKVAMLEDQNKLLKIRLAVFEGRDGDQKEAGPSQSDREEVRAVFDLFDTNHDGFLDVDELGVLHRKLGEPLTEEEQKVMLKELGVDGKGRVGFPVFLEWWWASHVGGTSNKNYAARFKLVHAKLKSGFDLKRLMIEHVGVVGTLEYRLRYFYEQDGGVRKPISPWHDIPLRALNDSKSSVFHFICEIPKWTRRKMEIATHEVYNPIKQDTRNGTLRDYKWGDMVFNYGALPQTWEDPNITNPDTGFIGDNDPIDVLELGTRQCYSGEVMKVKVLGVIALIDSKETDWKLLTISLDDPLASRMNDVGDIAKFMPGAVHWIREYLRMYKVCTGKEENTFGLEERAMPKAYALKVIEETHRSWCELRLRRPCQDTVD